MKKSLLLGLTAAVMTLYPVTAMADTPVTPTNPSESSATTTPPVTQPVDNSSTPPIVTSTTPVIAPADVAPAAPVVPLAPIASVAPTPDQGPTSPSGVDGSKYTLNPATGKYENDFYIWDPVTKQTSPKVAPTYSYNPITGMWDTTKWIFDAPSGKYVPNVIETPVTPPLSQQSAPILGAAALNNASGINNTGPDSSNTLNNNTNNNDTFNLFYNASISNNISQNAASGNALITGNTTGGSALTGNTTDIANLINMLQSTWSPLNDGNLTTFSGTIAGNVTGDLHIDPSSIGKIGPGSTQVVNNNTNNNLTVNAQATGSINNNVNLGSNTGNATVAGNTTGGNATTGNANAMANIINAISSSIAAGKSFLGLINITGNLNGDILLPPDVLNALIANSGPDTNSTINNTTNNSLNANITNNSSINNAVHANATTGTATTAGNTTAGDATTGAATTKVNILNLTGKQVVGKDALLVFVNVLGHWTGIIMNAPVGATSAALGGGLTQNNTTNNTTNLNAVNNNTINNNLNVNATSGDAVVTHNTTGGNATSGNANASVNIANIDHSNLSFSDWFGILFINVFGTWTGSFGVDTEAGNPAPAATTGSSSQATAPQTLRFVSKPTTPSGAPKVAYAAVTTPETAPAQQQSNTPAVLGNSNHNTPTGTTTTVKANQMNLLWVPFLGSGLGLMFMLVEEILRRRSLSAKTGTVATV